MNPAISRLLDMHDKLRAAGWYVAAERVEKAIVMRAFEDVMEREGMCELL